MLTSKVFNLRDDTHYIKYYPILMKWWQDWGFDPILPKMLSENGIMIFNKEEPICAGWLFKTDSNTAIVGWNISSKSKNRVGCVEKLIEELENLAKNLGFELLNYPASNPNLRNKLEKKGYGDFADKNITNYFKRIWVRQ